MEKRSYGASLLELMLILAIIAVIFMGIEMRYQTMRWNEDLETIKTSVALGKQALNLYFFQNKDSLIAGKGETTKTTTVSYQNLSRVLPANLLASMRNPWGQSTEPFAFYVTCTKIYAEDPSKKYVTNIQRCAFTITTQINKNLQTIAGIARMLGAGRSDVTNMISWHYIPEALTPEYSSNLQVMGSIMDNFANTLYQLDYPAK